VSDLWKDILKSKPENNSKIILIACIPHNSLCDNNIWGAKIQACLQMLSS
jgi:aminopeptidase-like protein